MKNKQILKNIRKLKIAIIDMDSLKNPFWGAGQARATYEVGKRLAKNHEVTVYTSKYPGFKDHKKDRITYHHIGLENRSSRLTNLFFILSVPFLAFKIKQDIILENFNAPFSVSLAPLIARKPVVGLPSIFDAERFDKKYHLPFSLIEKFGCRLYKYFLPYTKYQEDKMKKENPNIISRIIPEGVSDEFFKIKLNKPKHILFLGRFDISHKGIDLLLESYSKVVDKLKYPLILAGYGPDEPTIRQLIIKYNLKEMVKIIGPTFGNKKNKILSDSLFVALPSRNEAFSCFALEALACGLPLITFGVPGLSWINKEVTLRAKPFNTKIYADLMIKALDKKLLEKMGIEARLFARKFSWEFVTSEFENFFFSVLKESKS